MLHSREIFRVTTRRLYGLWNLDVHMDFDSHPKPGEIVALCTRLRNHTASEIIMSVMNTDWQYTYKEGLKPRDHSSLLILLLTQLRRGTNYSQSQDDKIK